MNQTRYNLLDNTKTYPAVSGVVRNALTWITGVSTAFAAVLLFMQAPAAFASTTTVFDNVASGSIGSDAFGCSTGACGQHKMAMLFYNADIGSLCSVQSVMGKYVGTSPTDNVLIKLYRDDGNLNNPEGGTFIDSITVSSPSYQTSPTNTGANSLYTAYPTMHFTNATGNVCHGLAVGTWYWLVYQRAGSYSNTDFFALGYYLNQAHRLWKKNTSDVWSQYSSGPNGAKVTALGLGDSQWIDNDSFTGRLSSASYNFTTHDYGALGNYFRDIILGAFMPRSDTFAQLSSLSAAIQNKPPFGWFTVARTAFTSTATSSAVTDMTLIGHSIQGVTGPWKTGVAAVLWIFFGVYVVKRFVHFQP